ncbi:spondin-2-like [Manduca sexta]|uniref:spondin-2-like n=1 Tax=Manduca sexta TaxID=7130 RepID=UPI00188E94A3|nr:spondin-2-like [Manduca sexta]
MRVNIFVGFIQISLILFLQNIVCNDEVCDRRPLGTKIDPLPPDNQFFIEIDGILDDHYIPQNEYIVRLKARDKKSTFIAFTISLQEDTIPNRSNPRKPIFLKAGRLELLPNSTTTKYSLFCNNTIMESDITAKNFVEVLWRAPDKENKCVTVFAVVAVKPNVWYSYEGPLSKRLCEDTRKADDMQPLENDNCRVCEDARYQLTFEGLWSYNTHMQIFPENVDLARFSDVVGASHSKSFSLYKYTSEATLGLKMLAEQGNTTKLELEIQEKLGKTVRTVIKATAPPATDMSTVTSFRATREHHLVSLATGLLPSPDWFLGAANLELCSVHTNDWADNIVFNLYPMDAGTDKGTKFESPNEELSPPQPISPLKNSPEFNKEEMKPLARLRLTLIRTYDTPNCSLEIEPGEKNPDEDNSGENGVDGGTDGGGGDGEGDGDGDNNGDSKGGPQETPEQTLTSAAPVADPESTIDCPMTTWEEWLPCEGDCAEGVRNGYRIRFRYHMVNGVAVGKFTDEGIKIDDRGVPSLCKKKYSSDDLEEIEECEESCEEEAEETTEAEELEE